MISKLRSYRLSRVTDLVTNHLLWNDEQYLLDIRALQSQVLAQQPTAAVFCSVVL